MLKKNYLFRISSKIFLEPNNINLINLKNILKKNFIYNKQHYTIKKTKNIFLISKKLLGIKLKFNNLKKKNLNFKFINNIKFLKVKNFHNYILKNNYFFYLLKYKKFKCLLKKKIYNYKINLITLRKKEFKEYLYKQKKYATNIKKLMLLNKKHLLFKKNVYLKFLNEIINKKNLNLTTKLTSFFCKNGKKFKTINAFFIVLNTLQKKYKLCQNKIILCLFLILQTKVEVRIIPFRKRSFSVPFSVSRTRQYFLVLKWFFFAFKKKNFISLKSKILNEFELLLHNRKTSCINLLKKNNTLVYKNQANAHYRW